VARFYHPGFGFTALIGFAEGQPNEAPALRAVPHIVRAPSVSSDGQFYAQRALDPLARDPAVDRAMDLAPYRARRILFSWTAYLAGLGRPAWIIEAYALQNVVCWLLLAILVTRWCDVSTPRGLAVWTACLFSHGLLWSVRFALLDGPSFLLIALSVLAVEKGRPLLSAAVTGIAALGRETNVLAAFAQPFPRSPREWRRAALAVIFLTLPILLWTDYLWSIYRSTLLTDTDQLVLPGSAFALVLTRSVRAAAANGLLSGAGTNLLIIAATVVQAAFVAIRRDWTRPWWRVAAGYVVLALMLNRVLWDPHTGALTRVLLPLTMSFNFQLAGENNPKRFWPWFLAGNLHLAGVFKVMPLV
jgi:hypothetical protein